MRMKRTFAACLAVTLMLGSICVASAKSVTLHLGYNNVTTKQMLAYYINDSGSKQTLIFNTRPTSGQPGAVVRVERESDGSLIGKHTFPYYQEIPNWSVDVPKDVTADIYIKAADTAYPVSGNLKYIYPTE